MEVINKNEKIIELKANFQEFIECVNRHNMKTISVDIKDSVISNIYQTKIEDCKLKNDKLFIFTAVGLITLEPIKEIDVICVTTTNCIIFKYDESEITFLSCEFNINEFIEDV